MQKRNSKFNLQDIEKNYGFSLLFLKNKLLFQNIYEQNAPDLQRYRLQSEAHALKNLFNSAIVIQKFIRMKICRKRFIKFIEEKYLKRSLPSVIKIQRRFRKILRKINEKFKILIQIILKKRVQACQKIQNFYRSSLLHRKNKADKIKVWISS